MNAATMNALVLRRIGYAIHERIPTPDPGENQVRVRVAFCGVCGSDLPRFFDKGPYSLPLVCGHEFAGTIEKLGPGVENFNVGDRVTAFPLIWCGSCGPCEEGRYAQCLRYDYLGSRSDGAFAEYVIVPSRNLMRVPDNVSLEEAAMTEPAAVALHALRRAGNCSPGQCVAIFGAGPIGLMVAQWARAMGASRVALFDIVPEKLDLGYRLGLTDVYNSGELNAVQVLGNLTGGLGAHICVDTAGVPETILNALQAAGPGGRVVLLGNPADDVALRKDLISQIMRREINIMGTWNSEYRVVGQSDDWHNSLDAMASGYLNVKPLITHKVMLRESFDVLRMMRSRQEFYCKVLICPGSQN